MPPMSFLLTFTLFSTSDFVIFVVCSCSAKCKWSFIILVYVCVGFCMMVLLFYIGTIPADSMALCVTPRNIRTETDWDV